jgi:hypothetical protein
MAMSSEFGIYLKTIREGRGLDPKDIFPPIRARGLNVDHSRLWRAENKSGHWPDGDFLTALVDVIGANPDDVAWFQKNPNPPDGEGERRAKEWLKMHAKDRQAVAKFHSYDPACSVCGSHSWEVADTIAAPTVEAGSDMVYPLFVPYRVMVQIICQTCGHVLLLDAGRTRPPEPEALDKAL